MFNSKNMKEVNVSRKQFKKSLLALSIMALSAPSFAQNTAAENNVEEIVITGMKGSLTSAQAIKREADTVKDVITASDIGALPDKSVTEALQRVPGVTIERFAASEDPNHFADEGTGVLVRGLDRVRSEINGRDSFSANANGGLNFEDIPPELLGSVEVVKNQTADLISGGIAGTVNLTTRKPFDSAERVVGASVKGTYGDFRESVTPAYSGLFSDRWETGVGEFGFLVSAAKSEYESRGDRIGVANFYSRYGTTAIQGIDGTGINGRKNQFLAMPGQISIGTSENDRDRTGLGTSLQWQNSEETVIATAEYIYSKAELEYRERVIGQQEQGFQVGAQTSINIKPGYESAATFNDEGMFTSGTLTAGPLLLSSRYNLTENEVKDASFHLTLKPTDKLTVDLDAQHIESAMDVVNNGINAQNKFPDVYVDLRGDRPTIDFLSPKLYEPSKVKTVTDQYLRTQLDQNVSNDAKADTFQADLAYEIDNSWITAVKGGAYVSEKDLTLRDTEYSNWGVLACSGWCTGGEEIATIGSAPDEYELVEFDNFYKGKTDSLSGANSFYFPKMSSAENLPAFTVRGKTKGFISRESGIAQVFLPNRVDGPFAKNHIGSVTDTKVEAYLRADFAFDDLSIPLKGNVGARYINYQLEATGFENFPAGITSNPQFYPANVIAFATGSSPTQPSTTVDGTDYTKVLPSFNISASLQDDLIARFAFSQGVFYPSMTDVRNVKVMQVSKTDVLRDPSLPESPTNKIVGVKDIEITGQARNPNLEPEESSNYDITLEWYFSESGSLTTSLFRKDLDNIIRERSFTQNMTNNGVTLPVSFAGPVNEGSGSIEGIELSYTQFYDQLPGAWSGLGLQVNYTFIDQQDLNERETDPALAPIRLDSNGNPLTSDGRNTFRAFTDLPLPSYSEHTFNIVGMYEYESYSARLAYNWRSEYLITRRDSNEFAPIYADDTGYLDASFFYTINDNLKVGVEIANLLDTETKTLAQYNQEGYKTDSLNFTTDRRYALSLRANF